MASQQMPLSDPLKKVKEIEDLVEAGGKESFGEVGRGQREKERVLVSDRARYGDIVMDKEVEEGRRGRESGGGLKFETKGEEKKGLGEKDKIEGRTRVVEGKEWNEEEKRRNNLPRGKVEAEKTRPMDKTREEAQRREKDETKEGGGDEQGRGREQNEELSLEDISKYRNEAQEKAMNVIEAAKEKYEREREKQAEIEASKERKKQANETGKCASKVAGDLRDNSKVKGWSAAHYSTEKAVEGTKAVTNAVEEAVEYLGQKAYELAAKSLDTATGLASATGENAKEYTARKKEEAERALEAKREAQNQESKDRPSAKATTESFRRGQGEPIQKEEGKLEVQGGNQEGGVLKAIGDTIAEIAETTGIKVAGEGEKEKTKSHEYEHAELKRD